MALLSTARIRGKTIARARLLVVSAVLLAVVSGEFTKTGLGTICSLGIGWLTVTCPLGFVQLALAAKDPMVQLWPSVALGVVSVVLAGRFFCSWICPTVLVKARLGGWAERVTKSVPGLPRVAVVAQRVDKATTVLAEVRDRVRLSGSYTRYGVLGGSLLSSFVFGLPVFCAVCPVGLSFGALFALKRLFLGQEPGWELLVFPAVILAEVLFAKSWCRSFCPLGALLGLLSPFNRLFRPRVDGEKCLRSRGAKCTICQRACPEEVALASAPGIPAAPDCTKCMNCFEICPTRAIRPGFPSRD